MDTVEDEGSERFARIHLTWRRSLWNWGRFSFERIHVSYELAVSFGFLFFFLIIPFDAALWEIRNAAFRLDLPLRSIWPATSILAANGPLNAVLLHRLYLQKNLQEHRVRPWIPILRGLLITIPFFGLLILFLWRWVLQHHPRWILLPESCGPALTLAAPAPRMNRRGLPVSRFQFRRAFIIVCASNTLGLTALCQLISRFSADFSAKWPLLTCSLALHLIAFLAVSAFLEVQATPGPGARRRKLLSSLPWLLPVPYLSLIGLLTLSWAIAETRRSKTITNHTFSQRERADRLTLWRRLESPRPSRPRIFPRRYTGTAATASQARSRFVALCDVKTFALALDIAVASWFLDFSTRSFPTASFFARGLLGMVLLVACAFGLVSLISSILALVRRWSGRPPSPWKGTVLARSLALVAIFLFFGTMQGLFWNRMKLLDSNDPLLWVVCIYISLKALKLIRFLLPHGEKSSEGLADHLLRLLCMIGIWIGQIVLSISAHLGRADLVLMFWAVYFLLGEVLPGLIRLPWLLRPYGIRDLASPDLPFGRKAVLAFLVFTVLAPGGGLAAPLWILWRDRLELENEATERRPSPSTLLYS